jgi:hypothetical protein
MLDFRKVLLAAAVAGLGLVGTASAQVACTAINSGTGVVAGSPTGIRIEGTTEQVKPISINTCSGTLNNGSFTVTLSLSVPITNVQLTGQTTTTLTDSVAIATGFAAITVANPTGQVVATGSSTPGSSSISYSFSGGSTTVAVIPASANITIYNLRVNPSALAANAAITVTAAGSASLIAPTTTATVAYAQTSLANKTFNGFANIAICNVATSDVNVLGIVGVGEAINNGFSSDADESGYEAILPFAPSAAYTASTGTFGAPTYANPIAVGTTTGSRLAVTFGNLGSGITYYLPVTFTSGTLTMTLISSPTCGPACPAVAGGTIGAATNKGNIGTTAVSGVAGFTPTSGTFTAYYSVTADNQLTVERSSFTGNFLAGTAYNGLSAGPGYAGIILFAQTTSTAVAPSGAPTVAVYLVGNTTLYGQFLAPAAPTVITASASSAFTPVGVTPVTVPVSTGTNLQPGGGLLVDGTGGINACNTTMIFPYLINTGGYDTGIALTNAGLGSSVSGNTVTATTAGVCTMSLWGAASLNGTAVTPFTLTPVNVAAGQVNAFTLSGALAGTANASGFAGYGIANCNFQGGHGFAFITDGFGTTPGRGLSQGYLAPLLSDIFGSAYASINAPF